MILLAGGEKGEEYGAYKEEEDHKVVPPEVLIFEENSQLCIVLKERVRCLRNSNNNTNFAI